MRQRRHEAQVQCLQFCLSCAEGRSRHLRARRDLSLSRYGSLTAVVRARHLLGWGEVTRACVHAAAHGWGSGSIAVLIESSPRLPEIPRIWAPFIGDLPRQNTS